MGSRRKICSKVRLTDVVPAPEEPVTEMIGYFADTSASYLTDIPQIAVGFSLILLPFRSPDKAKQGRLEADPSDFEPPPRPLLKDAVPSSRCTSAVSVSGRGTHHADETFGSVRSSAISRRMLLTPKSRLFQLLRRAPNPSNPAF